MARRLLVLVVALLLMTMPLSALSVAEGQTPIDVSLLICWNGGSSGWPADINNTPLGQVFTEKTGIRLIVETIATNETEKLNTIFMAGVVPDIVNGPYWSTTGGEGKAIKDAAVGGLIKDIGPFLSKYPNIQRVYDECLSPGFKNYDVFHPEYNGAVYVIPAVPGPNPTDVQNWAYASFARGDILDALGVKAEDVDTSEELYDLLVKIRDGGFKDTSGNPVIPGGTWHNGWSYAEFTAGFSTGAWISDFRQGADGNLYHWEFDPSEDQKVLFMRKLVSEGLFDKECFTQTDTLAKEKMAVGKVAVFGCHSYNAADEMTMLLYGEHPEMKYRLLGPIKMQNGETKADVHLDGASGSGVHFLSGALDDAKTERILSMIDFCNTTEGKALGFWGIEGTHYSVVDGKPQYLPDWKQKFKDDPTAKREQGFGVFGEFIAANDIKTLWPVALEDKTPMQLLEDEYVARVPRKLISGKISANYLLRDYPGLQAYQDATSTIDWGKLTQSAFFAASDEEALKIIEDARAQLKAAGVEDLCAYVQEKMQGRTDIGL